jgi:hypothetical protein
MHEASMRLNSDGASVAGDGFLLILTKNKTPGDGPRFTGKIKPRLM